MRYRDMENVDLVAVRTSVCEWLDEHPDGSFPEMAVDLKGNYPDFPEEMAVVLRGYMAAELRRRVIPPEVPLEPTATAGALR
jgi:hypothetical protein